MTSRTDERRRTREFTHLGVPCNGFGELAMLFQNAEGAVAEVAVVMRLHTDDPEGCRHQMLAQIVYEGRRTAGEPPWSKASRAERAAAYSLTDGLV